MVTGELKIVRRQVDRLLIDADIDDTLLRQPLSGGTRHAGVRSVPGLGAVGAIVVARVEEHDVALADIETSLGQGFVDVRRLDVVGVAHVADVEADGVAPEELERHLLDRRPAGQILPHCV